MKQKIAITGGAGFIGVHSSNYFSSQGWEVTVIDNLERRGTKQNLEWLMSRNNVTFAFCDIKHPESVNEIIKTVRPDVVLHLAAQVAVTTSVTNPRHDFLTNALGTFNVLEAVRTNCPESFFINASTNKVYGKMESVGICERNGRYEYDTLIDGVDEEFPLDFYSPYGCSKGTADQYTLDYARIYGIASTTFRQSCIYGTRQFGIEDQGWVAWFAIASTLKKQITVYGDGKQIRDVLHVSDLVRAYASAIGNRDKATGQAFNVGGGANNTLSLLELLEHLAVATGRKIPFAYGDWRPGDQKVFMCNIGKAKEILGWSPTINVQAGVQELIDWVQKNPEMFDWLA
jgi:CDP-paratose 2-epimerase